MICSSKCIDEVQSLTAADKLKQLNARKRLKKCITYQDKSIVVSRMKIFFTVETPANCQNDCVYANVKAKCVVLLILFSNSLLAS